VTQPVPGFAQSRYPNKKIGNMEYQFRSIEKKWQKHWQDNHAYRVSNISDKPKCYVLDMFPYPSGAGLHVGHPLGYIASDIYSRFKRLKGFNVLHPMGYDAFGLPAEQYAIEHGVHPAVSTKQNIDNFRKQLDNIGFCYDWEREVRTCEPNYYKWTQWIFLQLFNSFYNRQLQKAQPITDLIAAFETAGSAAHPMPDSSFHLASFSAAEWAGFDEPTKQAILMEYRLAYSGEGEVNWCEALGTVLANDEVVNGVSERGGHPVVKKKLCQWYLRITEYADRLQNDLQKLEWSDAMKEMQTNWIGKSSGAEIDFVVSTSPQPLSKGEGQKEPGYFTSTPDKWKALIDYAKANRKNPTAAEAALWAVLRNRQLNGWKFRRQHPVAGYIPDFVCLDAKLIIEVDGGYHSEVEQHSFDALRTEWLNEHGFTMLRFSNEEVLEQIDTVKSRIEEVLGTPSPLEREKEGEVVLRVYTTRPDTIFGVDFMVVAPEHEVVAKITTAEQTTAVEQYLDYVNSRSERERMAEKKITGCFTGAFAINPFSGRAIPIWISEYVLAGYGTGAIMAVPCGDERDHKFAQHFNIPITNIIGDAYNGTEANPTKDAVLENSDFLNGMVMRKAIEVVIDKLEALGIGTRKTNYRMRDAAFSRQRYWGEPFPIVWVGNTAYALPESELPLLLPEVESYSPGPEGQGPLANIPEWTDRQLETNTMPGYAGSSWYFLRYMDPGNDAAFASRQATDYWNQVDVYIGGTEHAVGHLLYSRMWTKALYDLGHLSFDEPFKKLVNQGMIQGSSRFVYRVIFKQDGSINPETLKKIPPIVVTKTIAASVIEGDINAREELLSTLEDAVKISINEPVSITDFDLIRTHVDVNIVDGYELDMELFRKWKPEFAQTVFINNGYVIAIPGAHEGLERPICEAEVEKMSKSKFNTVNPDMLVDKYGADTFRMYEMFLGPIEQSKPWDTKGIEGVHRFLKKFWRLFFDEQKGAVWNNDAPTDAEFKSLHKAIKKIEEDTERFSFNTAVSAFMICVNELSDLKCNKRAILEPLCILMTPYAPHIAEELWHALGNAGSVLDAAFPVFEPKYLVESSKEYPVSINGKVRTSLSFALDADQATVEAGVLANEVVQKWLEGKPPKKIIYVKGKMINVVI
jgi:leucyl-tRNA synthetase